MRIAINNLISFLPSEQSKHGLYHQFGKKDLEGWWELVVKYDDEMNEAV